MYLIACKRGQHVTDFGLAKRVQSDRRQTRSGAIVPAGSGHSMTASCPPGWADAGQMPPAGGGGRQDEEPFGRLPPVNARKNLDRWQRPSILAAAGKSEVIQYPGQFTGKAE
jgi:hypothetical protein